MGFDDLKTYSNESRDYGLYTVYGSHPLYGADVLLYIGKANHQTFAKRIVQHDFVYFHEDSNALKFYLGRFCKTELEMNDDIWTDLIDDCESLLIHAHRPALNSSNIVTIPNEKIRDLHIFNWGAHRSLFPEVSGARWSDRFDDLDTDQLITAN